MEAISHFLCLARLWNKWSLSRKQNKKQRPSGGQRIAKIEKEKWVVIEARTTACSLFGMTADVRAPSCFSGRDYGAWEQEAASDAGHRSGAAEGRVFTRATGQQGDVMQTLIHLEYNTSLVRTFGVAVFWSCGIQMSWSKLQFYGDACLIFCIRPTGAAFSIRYRQFSSQPALLYINCL